MSTPKTRVLTNLYLPPAEGYVLRTFGDYLPGGLEKSKPAWRAEKERRPLAEILPLIPAAERPDILILTSPEYLPIPVDVADFPGLKILLITDWNVCLRFLPDLCPLFDFCFTDWPGYRLLRKAGIANVHHQPLFGHDPAAFLDQGKPRNLDVSFCGNLNAGLHGERNRLLARLGAWGAARPGRSIHLRQAFNQDYLDVLNRSRLVFNYSIRGEANMRLFEAMACGAVPLVEASNQETAILFQEGRHYFRYEPGTLEATIESLLADPARIASVADAARTAVARHTKGDQVRSLLDHAVREAGKGGILQGNTGVTLAPPPPGARAASIPSLESLKALIKLRVLGAAYTMPEALAELQSRGESLPGLAAETLPAALISLIENHPGESFA
ncbi:MAG: glycosyltransferase, partial [Fibrobacteria bacterium]